MPSSAPLPVPTITAVGVASPMAHGQAITSTATMLIRARVNCETSALAGARKYQARKVTAAIANHRRDEDRRNLVGQLLDGGLAALGFLHQADDLRQGGLAPDLGGFESAAGPAY